MSFACPKLSDSLIQCQHAAAFLDKAYFCTKLKGMLLYMYIQSLTFYLYHHVMCCHAMLRLSSVPPKHHCYCHILLKPIQCQRTHKTFTKYTLSSGNCCDGSLCYHPQQAIQKHACMKISNNEIL